MTEKKEEEKGKEGESRGKLKRFFCGFGVGRAATLVGKALTSCSLSAETVPVPPLLSLNSSWPTVLRNKVDFQ